MIFTKNNIDETWLTRNNKICQITQVFEDGTFKFIVYGIINGKENMWTVNGENSGVSISDLDLIRKVTKSEHPEYFV